MRKIPLLSVASISLLVASASALCAQAPATDIAIQSVAVAPAQLPALATAPVESSAPAPVVAGPVSGTTAAAFQTPIASTTRNTKIVSDPHMGAGQNVALMGVGAAALITGLLIGGNSGTVVAIGGGVIGLYGLYRFLQ